MLTLAASVAFAERMDGVDLTEVVGGADGEGNGGEVLEVVFGEDVFENRME